jgi:small subunit ribosomal protein S7e
MASSKIIKEKGVTPNELEDEVAKALTDLEAAPGNDMRAELKELKFSGAKEIECSGAKNAIVIFVPYKIYTSIKKVTAKLIRELEKKFQKKHILIVANRTIMGKNFRRKGIAVRPRSRTLTNVHEAILEDVVFPTEITGKRVRVKPDGSKVMKIFLDKKEKESVEEKLGVFSSVYRQLTNKDAQFALL